MSEQLIQPKKEMDGVSPEALLVDTVYSTGKKSSLYPETNIVFHGDFKVLIIGDLHISDKPSSVHRDYLGSAATFLEDVTTTIREKKITHVILTGDLVGRTTEKNFQTREALMYFQKVLLVWNRLTNNNVYSDVGNHDMGEILTDFEYLVTVEAIKVVDSIEFDTMKLHIIKYGDDYKEVEVAPNKLNVAVMHTELHVEGATGWFFRSHEGKELSELENLYGIDMVVCGHIHNPSERILETSIRDHPIKLVYPGNPTRPKKNNDWKECFGVIYESTNNDVNFIKEVYELEPLDTFFAKSIDDYAVDKEDIDVEALVESGDLENRIDLSQISDIMGTIAQYNLSDGVDYINQITALAGDNTRARDLAIATIQREEQQFKLSEDL